MHTHNADKSPAEIRQILNDAGFTFSDLDRQFGLPIGTSNNASKRPEPRGEIAIASKLDVPPSHIWPSRYSNDGKRLCPQPNENYTAKPAVAKRQKFKVA